MEKKPELEKKPEDVKLDFTSENLAVPEVHTGKLPETPEKPEEPEASPPEEPISVQFDTLAVPEVKLHRPKEK